LALLGHTVANYADCVIELGVVKVLRVDTTSVSVIKFVSGLNSALNWTMLSEFTLHLIGANHTVILGNIVLFVSDRCTVLKTIFISGRSRRSAVTTDVKVSASTVYQIVCNVLFTAGVRDTGGKCVFVNLSGISTIA